MAKYLGPKCKRARRLGIKLDTKDGSGGSLSRTLSKRNYPPGFHGPKGYPRLTDYGVHLQEKQKIKLLYGILERQLRKYFEEAMKLKSDTGIKLMELLERRLDNVIYRLGLAASRSQARQFVSHSLFLINGKKINVPSCRVKSGDVITIRKKKSLEQGLLAENLKNINKNETPSWLTWNSEKNQGQVVSLPQGTELELGIDTRLVVEFYSK